MGLTSNLLVMPAEHEEAARNILLSQRIEGADNLWADTAESLITPYLAA